MSPAIRRLVLDVMKPQDPDILELADTVGDCPGVGGVNAVLVETCSLVLVEFDFGRGTPHDGYLDMCTAISKSVSITFKTRRAVKKCLSSTVDSTAVPSSSSPPPSCWMKGVS